MRLYIFELLRPDDNVCSLSDYSWVCYQACHCKPGQYSVAGSGFDIVGDCHIISSHTMMTDGSVLSIV